MSDRRLILEKEIDLIQECINRMANNSFLIKGWTITIVTVVFPILYSKIEKNIVIFFALVMIGCFWYLDSYFLNLERLYRRKYEWVIRNRLINENYFYDLNPYNKKMWISKNHRQSSSIIKVMFSKTIFPIYFSLFILFLLYILFN